MPSASKILTLFTRTPLHVGAGASVGAIDQPIVRERPTGLPIIPGSSLKGVLADLWSADTVTTTHDGGKTKTARDLAKDITWLFGSDNDKEASAGALSFGEARLLAFPIRSAKGSFAWLTSPLLLARAARDGVAGLTDLMVKEIAAKLTGKDADALALFAAAAPIAIPVANGAPKPRLVLEDYPFTHAGELPASLAAALQSILPGEPVLGALPDRLVIVSDGMLSFFAKTACEIAQHVRINDATGTAEDGGLFNQENVPSETLFYAVIHATQGRSAAHRQNQPAAALAALDARLKTVNHTIQIGGDATTGLGYCTAVLA
jgi:CRISPR-associated protein Cmr4